MDPNGVFSFASQKCNWRNEILEKEIDAVLEVIVAIRRLKKVFGVAAKHKPEGG